jgi:hypothetical protein
MFVTYFSTALGLTFSASTIPLLERPSAISRSTWSSRGVSRSIGSSRRRTSNCATTSGSRAVPPAYALPQRVTQARVLRSEWTKLRTQPSAGWALLSAAVLIIGFGILYSLLREAGHRTGPRRPVRLIRRP